jgi:hypothetical protein
MNEEKDRRSLYLVDERLIEDQSDEFVLADADLRTHVQMINIDLNFIDELLRAHIHRTSDELIVHRLAVRCFNSGAAALQLARSGYYQPCIAIIRDIMETSLLLDLFSREPTVIGEWTRSTEKERDRKFSAYQVRLRLEVLDVRDSGRVLNRAQTYKRFCTYGTHPSPEGFSLISPNMMTQIGPFPDEGRLRAVIEEIALHLTFASIVIANFVDSEKAEVINLQVKFFTQTDIWANKYLRSSSQNNAKQL